MFPLIVSSSEYTGRECELFYVLIARILIKSISNIINLDRNTSFCDYRQISIAFFDMFYKRFDKRVELYKIDIVKLSIKITYLQLVELPM